MDCAQREQEKVPFFVSNPNVPRRTTAIADLWTWARIQLVRSSNRAGT